MGFATRVLLNLRSHLCCSLSILPETDSYLKAWLGLAFSELLMAPEAVFTSHIEGLRESLEILDMIAEPATRMVTETAAQASTQ